jgi:hypothetical protein
LLDAVRLVEQLQQQVGAGDFPAAAATLTRLQQETGEARAATRGLSWRVGGAVPGVGPNLVAVAKVADAVDSIARRGAPALLLAARDLTPTTLALRNGRIDLTGLQRVEPALALAHIEVVRARSTVAAIATGGLTRPLRSAIAQLLRGLDRLAAVTDTASRAATLLPLMLGADGPRTYLVLFQNLAEVRATGGMWGAFAVVRADHGRVAMIQQGTAAADLKSFDRPVLPLDPAMLALYTDRLGTFPADVNLTPHFPTAAALAREMYRRRTGRTVDGVFATDPVALSYLLRATGPVPLAHGESLTGESAVRLLLSEGYTRFRTPEGQDEFFAGAAKATFDMVSHGGADPAAVLASLAQAAGQRRILLWSAHPHEQRIIDGTMLDGALPLHDGQAPTVGVFLNDGSGAKLDYYLTQAAALRVVACRSDGRLEMRLRVTLGSTAPRSGLPAGVLGMGLAGDPYTIRTNVLIFSPAGGAVQSVSLDGNAAPIGAGRERRRGVGVLTVNLRPGATRTVEASLLTGVLPQGQARAAEPRLWTTPMVTPWRIDDDAPHKCRR